MKNIANLRGFILMTFFLLGSAAFPCTGVTAATGQQVLVGNNEDYGAEYTDTVVRVRPGEQGKYGCLLVGFDRHNFSMGGINDQGLFFDMFTVPYWIPCMDIIHLIRISVNSAAAICMSISAVTSTNSSN